MTVWHLNENLLCASAAGVMAGVMPGPQFVPPAAMFDELVDACAAGGRAALRQHISDMCPGCATDVLVHTVELAYRYGNGYCVCDTRRHDGPPCDLHAPARYPQ